MHSIEEVRAALHGFEIESLLEEDHDGSLCTGEPKHWHLFSVVAKKRWRSMKKQVLFIQGGGEGAYKEDEKLAAALQNVLGNT